MRRHFTSRMEEYSGKVQNFSIVNVLLNSFDQSNFEKVTIIGIDIENIDIVIWVSLVLIFVNFVLMLTALFENQLRNEDSDKTLFLTLNEGKHVKKYVGVVESDSLSIYRWQKFIFVFKLVVPTVLFVFCAWLSY